MRKEQLLVILILCGVVLTKAQNTAFTVLYTNSSSGITHEEQAEQPTKVFAGRDLPETGTLRLAPGKWINIVYDGNRQKLEGPLVINMGELAGQLKQTEGSTFLGRFWRFLSNSVSQTSDKNEIEKYHRRFLTNSRAGISGFGDRQHAISVPVYFSEVIGDSLLNLRWKAIPDAHGYFVQLESRSDQRILLRANTQTARLALNLQELKVEPGVVYKWQVTAEHPSKELASPYVYFSYEPGTVQEFIYSLRVEEDLDQLEAFEQQLYIAHELENSNYYHAAYTRYQELLKEDPGNQLYQKLFTAFLARMDAMDEARTYMEQTQSNNE